MNIQISKWGNSLALRIPASFIKEIKLKDGDKVEATLSKDGSLIIRPQKLERKEIAAQLRAFRATLKMGKSVMEEVRSKARY
ncbi:MazF family transcriptional regulator [Polynucleobacter hirudinilacicola]|jgi:antitoxin MazE|uniref:MazF family transcriptional regulator n=1 Tax=Polynucleobacter hirudinilacicola TaxID=1743166 RepID=A0A210RYJ4_9BURK|nr:MULTISPECIES: AbrB/MazE/SpoVT family DNA-binding domain-containing protein [Polynucleobacter]MBU3580352.1 AbrB/MazE/SpoVT family DNA-binding domain-containing protein [Polynucleobacter sp. 73C-SIWE]OWF66010.1 MazF family transcriptional regulator [Polynucleobacter hirudinilacicola]